MYQLDPNTSNDFDNNSDNKHGNNSNTVMRIIITKVLIK